MVNVTKSDQVDRIIYDVTYSDNSTIEVIVYKYDASLKFDIKSNKQNAETWRSFANEIESSKGITITNV